MKLKIFLTALGLGISIAGAAAACDNGMCGSGWQTRGGGSYDRYGGGSSYGCNTCGGGHDTGYTRNNNSNYNANYNANYNNNSAKAYGGNAYQTQGQGQGQEQSQSVANSGNNTASLTNSGNSSASANNNSDNRNNVNVSYSSVQKQAVATAYAAPLVASADTCMGSSSVGGQGLTIGFSAATTWTDKNCVRLKNSRELNAMGMGVVACELLAQDREVAEALRRSGMNCGVFIQQSVAVAPPPPVYEEPPPVFAPPPVYPRAGERG